MLEERDLARFAGELSFPENLHRYRHLPLIRGTRTASGFENRATEKLRFGGGASFSFGAGEGFGAALVAVGLRLSLRRAFDHRRFLGCSHWVWF